MANVQTSRFLTLIHREFREYKNSLFWTPVILAGLLAVLMLGSVFFANRIAGVGDTILEALMREDASSVSVSFSVSEDSGEEITVVHVTGVDGDVDVPRDMEIRSNADGQSQRMVFEFGDEPAPGPLPEPPLPQSPETLAPETLAPETFTYEVVPDDEVIVEQWNFSREWSFNPEPAGDDEAWTENNSDMSGRELNVMLSVVHGILLLVLLLTTVNYLLSSLYDDRKDRSVLFWRSMPVSELEVVLSKLVTALIVAPLIYIAISLLLQLAYVLLTMLLVWRMDQDPFAVVVDNIDLVAVMLDPLSGWVMTALLIAPAYAWLLCASALAKRSPFLMAIAPVIGLFIIEGIFLGTEFIGDAVQNHVPHVTETTAVGFYLFGPDWGRVDLVSVGSGLAFAAVLIAATTWLRQHRWELN